MCVCALLLGTLRNAPRTFAAKLRPQAPGMARADAMASRSRAAIGGWFHDGSTPPTDILQVSWFYVWLQPESVPWPAQEDMQKDSWPSYMSDRLDTFPLMC